MRYILTTTLLLIGFSSLNAATFLERFNALEQDLQNVQDDLQAIKQNKAGTVTSSTPSNQPADDKELKALQEAVQLLSFLLEGLFGDIVEHRIYIHSNTKKIRL